MIFKQLFDNNSSTYTYLIASANGREALIIDPVEENVAEYIKLLEELNLKLVKVIDTHIHADHVTGASKLKNNTNCTTIMGENSPAETVDLKLKDGEIIKVDQLEFKALYTPGHTSDSYSFLMNNYLFSGDTLLINGTGRTDFQNGSSEDAYNSLFNKLLKLPEETLLYPGHDYNGRKNSTIGDEKKFNPRFMVDLATLTGAIIVSLGSEYAGLFSNDDKLSKQLIEAGDKVDEKLWRMPLHKNLDKLIDSKNADMQNINYVVGAGSTTAAQFLQRFVLNKTPWAHLDIAGMAFSKYGGALNSGGATGFGVLSLYEYFKSLS